MRFTLVKSDLSEVCFEALNPSEAHSWVEYIEKATNLRCRRLDKQ
jgi:hypothetical protein